MTLARQAARMFSDTFAGISPSTVSLFVLMQLLGGAFGLAAVLALFTTEAGGHGSPQALCAAGSSLTKDHING